MQHIRLVLVVSLGFLVSTWTAADSLCISVEGDDRRLLDDIEILVIAEVQTVGAAQSVPKLNVPRRKYTRYELRITTSLRGSYPTGMIVDLYSCGGTYTDPDSGSEVKYSCEHGQVALEPGQLYALAIIESQGLLLLRGCTFESARIVVSDEGAAEVQFQRLGWEFWNRSGVGLEPGAANNSASLESFIAAAVSDR